MLENYVEPLSRLAVERLRVLTAAFDPKRPCPRDEWGTSAYHSWMCRGSVY